MRGLIHEIIFILLVLVSFADVLGFAPGDINLCKDIIGWFLLAYLFYKISFTKIIIGYRHAVVDSVLILVFFLFAVKDLSHSAATEELFIFSFIKDFFYSKGILIFNKMVVFLGLMSFCFLSFVLAKAPYLENSILGVIRHPRERITPRSILLNLLVIFSILLFFSYFIFAVVMEWFALALDSYVVIGALVYYLVVFYILRGHSGYRSVTHLVVDTGDRIVSSFLELFRTRKTIFFGISGLIVIHSLMDLFNFLIPYVMNIGSFYLDSLSPENHKTLLMLFFEDLVFYPGYSWIFLLMVYVQNIIAVFLLLFTPFYIWGRMFLTKDLTFTRFQVSIFFSSLLTFIMLPVLHIGALSNSLMVGVDISTGALGAVWPLPFVVIISFLWFLIFYFISARLKSIVEEIMIFVSLFFLGKYIYYFNASTILYYLDNISYAFSGGEYVLGICFILYLLIIVIFYISAFMLLIAEVLQSEHISFFRLSIGVRRETLVLWALTVFIMLVVLIEFNAWIGLTVLIVGSLLLSIILFNYEIDSARYIFYVNLVLVLFGVTSLISGLFPKTPFLELIERLFILPFVLLLCYSTGSGLGAGTGLRRIFYSLFFGGLFGVWFSVIGEPKPDLYSFNVLYVVFFSLVVSLNEELIFRSLFFRVSGHLYSRNQALVVQSVLFTLLHLMNFGYLLDYFRPVLLVCYTLSLFIFSMVMGLLSLEKEKVNPVYAVIAHTVSNSIFLLQDLF